MRLGSLSHKAIRNALNTSGLSFSIGNFSVNLQSPFHVVAAGMSDLYGDYPLLDGSVDFIDFHMTLTSPSWFRNLYRPQVEFRLDGFRPFAPLPQAQAFAMFEWSLNWCVANHMHNYLIIHAAVLEREGRAVIMPGVPGAGKSTLAASLAMSGWRLLSDELTIIDFKTGNVIPFPRPINLKNESIDIIKKRFSGVTIGPVAKDTNKGTVAHLKAPLTSIRAANDRATPAWVVFPKYCAQADASMTPMPKAHAFMQVGKNSFNYTVLREAGFDALTNLIDQCQCYEFCYSQIDDALSDFNKLADEAL